MMATCPLVYYADCVPASRLPFIDEDGLSVGSISLESIQVVCTWFRNSRPVMSFGDLQKLCASMAHSMRLEYATILFVSAGNPSSAKPLPA